MHCTRLPTPLALLALAGSFAALLGGLWDDAWHTERGRDDFWIAPHLAIYAGISLAGSALGTWAVLVARRAGTAGALRHAPLVLGLLGVAATLGAAPVDEAWHQAFGRDAVIWSPPHLLGIAGTLVLAAALAAELGRDPRRRGLALAAGAGVLAAATFPVVEFETDVPQFDEALYAPALALGATFALLVMRGAMPGRRSATQAAAAHLLLAAVASAALVALGFPAPQVPLVLVLALALDAGWGPWRAAAALVAAVVVVRNGLGDGLRLDAADVALTLPLTAVAILAAAVLAGGRRGGRALLAGTAAAAAFAAAAPAQAHDPGQGRDAGTVALSVDARSGDRAVLTARLEPAPCARTTPFEVVARRAGEERRAALRRSGCTLRGTVPLDARGRWFVYARMRQDGRDVETWLPVHRGERIADEARYAYVAPARATPVTKIAGGAAMLAAVVALLVATGRLVRRG